MNQAESNPGPQLVIEPFETDTQRRVRRRLSRERRLILIDPKFSLASLRRFVDDEEDEDSPLLATWSDLTDSQRSLDYTFDPGTLEAISADSEASSLRNQEDAGVRFRARRLEIFLTRVQAIRTLGETSIEGTE